MTAPYTGTVLRYAITDGSSYAGNSNDRLQSLVQQTARWAAAGIDLIQLREKHLPAGQLAELTRHVLTAAAQAKAKTQVLVSSRADIAVAAGAHGVHLTAAPGELTPRHVRQVFQSAGRLEPFLSISCHTLDEVHQAAKDKVHAILFGPVFGKSIAGVEVSPAAGLDRLHEACQAAGHTQVFALGGVTNSLIGQCLRAGAAGVAGIRLLQNFPDE